jgi:hypothetical protein
VPGVLIGGLVLAGGGAVLAAAGGSSSPGSAAKTQYCPDGSVRHGGKKCKPKKHKKPHFRVHRNPRRGCMSTSFSLRVSVVGRPAGHRTFVYRDGRRVRATNKNPFTVHVNVARLSPGKHTILMRVRGSDGKWARRTVTFRRC